MNTQRAGRRDVALTTLIDLLVQVVFVFTLLLIASGAIEGSPGERGYVSPEVWKTLVSIFDVDASKSAFDQIKEIENRYNITRTERDAAIRDREALRKTVNELDARIAELEKRTPGAPGLPPCRETDGTEVVVLSASINVAGGITTLPLPGVHIPQKSGLIVMESKRALSRQEFQQMFSPWRDYGLSRDPKCKYTSIVQYDPRAPAGEYQPSISAIFSVFRIQKITRQGE